MNNTLYWRTSNGGTYVDSFIGDDYNGDGTAQNPYQSLGRAWRGSSGKPGTITCRGYFAEDMADGNHAATIQGDYYGAAVFDGLSTYMLYGFRHTKMIIKNLPLSGDFSVNTRADLAGVGSAYDASIAGNAYVYYDDLVYGLSGPSCFVQNSPVYIGCIGGYSNNNYEIYDTPKYMSTSYKLYFGGYMAHSTVYNVALADRINNSNRGLTSYRPSHSYNIYAKCDFWINEQMTFNNCYFTSDCNFYKSDGTKIEMSGTQEERLATIQAVQAQITSGEKTTFNSCVFGTKTAEETFNNPTHGDFTLKLTAEAFYYDKDNKQQYYGALPPSINIPILANSDGTPQTWDEHSISGILGIKDNSIYLNEDATFTEGEILSKIIKLDVNSYYVNAIWGLFESKLPAFGVLANTRKFIESTYNPGETLPVGRYKVNGSIMYKEGNYTNGTIINVKDSGTTYTVADDNSGAGTLSLLHDVNIEDAIYVRCSNAIYRTIKASEGLQKGATYYNNGPLPITYAHRTIAPGESFIATNSTDTFTAPNSDYEIAVMFDDTRVPTFEWIPASSWGQYFVATQFGAIKTDEDGIPYGSGNYKSWQSEYGSIRTPLNSRYCQFRIYAKRI